MFVYLILFVILGIFALLFHYFKFRTKIDQIPGPPVDSILLGNLKSYFIKPTKMSKSEYIKSKLTLNKLSAALRAASSQCYPKTVLNSKKNVKEETKKYISAIHM